MSGAATAAWRAQQSVKARKNGEARAPSQRYNRPSFEWEGFGRKSTMPSWYNVREGDELRRPIERWEASTISTLGHVPKVLTSRAPFVHSADGRCYRPEVCPDKTVFVPQPAPPGQRYLLEAPTNGGGQYNHAAVAGTPWCGKPAREIEGLRHRKETGTDAKYKALHEASIQSRGQGRANYRESLKTDLQATLHGQGRPVAQPILYPQGLTHQMALSLEGKQGPALPYDKRPPTDTSEYKRVSQRMYLPYNRTTSSAARAPEVPGYMVDRYGRSITNPVGN